MTYARNATGPFYHGTRADLAPGDLLSPGFGSNYADRQLAHIYFSGTLDAAIWGCELARGPKGNEDARERIYVVEPTGAFEDDPDLTDKRFPGNPTESYRSREPLRVVGEVETWEPHPPERLAEMKAALARMDAEGGPDIIDWPPASGYPVPERRGAMATAVRSILALGALTLAAPIAVQAQTVPAIPVQAAPAESLFAIVLAPGPAWKPGKPFQEQGLGPHLQYWLALHREGHIVTAGPLGDDSGLVVFYAADAAAARAILAGDPAIAAGVFTGTVRPYAPPMVNAARLAAGQD